MLTLSTTIVSDVEADLDRNNFSEDQLCKVTDDNFPEYSWSADCSYRNITDIQDVQVVLHHSIIKNITYWTLVGNSIKRLNQHLWKYCTSLRYLLLARNEIAALKENDFKDLSQLVLLDLSLNHIRYTSISNGVFKPLLNLQYLDLKQNFDDIWHNETYPNGLSQLPNLKYLMIDGLDHKFWPKVWNLSELYLSGEYGRCNITNLTSDYFSGVQNVEHLFVSNCSVQQVSNGTFGNMTMLRSLDLARNVKLGIKSVPNITFGLNVHKTIESLNLNSLHDYIYYDMCSSIQESDIQYLYDTSIQMLLIERNYLVRMSESAVKLFPKFLRYLSISDNMFMFGRYVNDMLKDHTMYNLVYFDSSKMYKSHIPITKYRTAHYESITSESQGEKSYANKYYPEKLETCTHFCNMLTRFRVIDDFADMCYKIRKHNIGATKMPSLCTKKNNGQFVHSHEVSSLEYLDLSDNLPGTIEISKKFFNNTHNLKFLNISNNYLGYPLLDDDKNINVFESVRNLQTLDLSNNRITKLKSDVFVNMTHLQYLYLANNKLTKISFNISHLQSLTYLDLSNNHLTEVYEDARASLDKLTNITINLQCNKLVCTCKNIEFVKWLKKIKDLNETICSFENSTPVAVKDLDYDQFYFECSPPAYHSIILATSLSLLAFIITVTCALVYRFKWNLRYLYYMTKFKLAGGYQPIDGREYDKDVFVSYANEDRIFVRNHIVKELETNGTLSLLVHDRDFCAGELVADNIMRAITSTRRTVVVLTTAYIRSKWCMYELNMARMEAADTGRNVLCVILREDIPVKYLPIEVIDIIKKKTYMEYPTEEEHMKLFWNRLRASLCRDI